MYAIITEPVLSNPEAYGVIPPRAACSARQKFVVHDGSRSVVPILYISRNFSRWFLRNTETVTEVSAQPIPLEYRVLNRIALDDSIVPIVGTLDEMQVSLSTVYAFLVMYAKQAERNPASQVHLFYTPDSIGTVRAVYLCQSPQGFGVCADEVGYERPWQPGTIVYYPRQPVATQALSACA